MIATRRRPSPHANPRWPDRPILTGVLFLSLGAFFPNGCSSSWIIGAVDSYLAVVILASSLAAGFAGPALLQRFGHRRVAALAFAFGMCAAVVVHYAWRPFSDWYYMKRCRDGVPTACVQAFTQGSARTGRDDYYAPRRACALGKVAGCVIEFALDKTHNAETCESAERICAGGFPAGPGHRRQACQLVEENCKGAGATEP